MISRLKLSPMLGAGLLLSTLTYAQDTQQVANGWPRQEQTAQQQQPAEQQPVQQEPDAGQADDQGQNAPPANYPEQRPQQQPPQYGPPQYGQPTYAPQGYPPAGYPNGGNPYGPAAAPAAPVPPQLTITPGTYVTVRVNQRLSTDHNQKGDAFSATLVQPIVVNGFVLAEPGETVGGVVAVSEKGHVGEVARLGLQLTNLTLIDGQQLPVETQFIARNGQTDTGRDVGTVATTTVAGTIVGSAVGWGTGAAIGAGAGAAAGLIGVLVTRGHNSTVYPEQILTFRIEAPATISTVNAVQAFHYVQPGDYQRPQYTEARPRLATPYYYGYPGWGYPYPYPYYWGPPFGVVVGRGGYWGRGYYRHWR